MQVLGRKDLAGEQDRPERGELDLGQLAAEDEQREDRRHRVPHGDPRVADPSRLLDGEEREAVGYEYDGGAGARGGEQVEDGEVEMERGVAREPVLRGHLELVRGPVDERERVLVREHHALRNAGRAGRVEDVRQIRVGAGHVLGRRVGLRVERRSGQQADSVGRLGLPVVGDRRDEDLDGSALVQQLWPELGLLHARDEAAEVGVRGDRRETCRRRRRVERDVRGAELEDRVDADEALERLVEVEPDQVAVLHAALSEQMREPVRPGVELGVGQAAVAVDDRRAVGMGRRRVREEIVEKPHRPMFFAATSYCSSDVPE